MDDQSIYKQKCGQLTIKLTILLGSRWERISGVWEADESKSSIFKNFSCKPTMLVNRTILWRLRMEMMRRRNMSPNQQLSSSERCISGEDSWKKSIDGPYNSEDDGDI